MGRGVSTDAVRSRFRGWGVARVHRGGLRPDPRASGGRAQVRDARGRGSRHWKWHSRRTSWRYSIGSAHPPRTRVPGTSPCGSYGRTSPTQLPAFVGHRSWVPPVPSVDLHGATRDQRFNVADRRRRVARMITEGQIRRITAQYTGRGRELAFPALAQEPSCTGRWPRACSREATSWSSKARLPSGKAWLGPRGRFSTDWTSEGRTPMRVHTGVTLGGHHRGWRGASSHRCGHPSPQGDVARFRRWTRQRHGVQDRVQLPPYEFPRPDLAGHETRLAGTKTGCDRLRSAAGTTHAAGGEPRRGAGALPPRHQVARRLRPVDARPAGPRVPTADPSDHLLQGCTWTWSRTASKEPCRSVAGSSIEVPRLNEIHDPGRPGLGRRWARRPRGALGTIAARYGRMGEPSGDLEERLARILTSTTAGGSPRSTNGSGRSIEARLLSPVRPMTTSPRSGVETA